MTSRSRVDFDDRETYYRDDRRSNVEVRVMDRERERDRVPAFLREDNRRAEPGPLVLRQREVETSERIRRRSPSPVRHVRARSVSPAQARRATDDLQFRTVRAPSRGPSEIDRVRIIERERSISPSPERARPRFVERRPRSPSPDFHEHIRIVEKERERERPRSPTPPPQPQVIKGPIIEREVITHYRDIDHGVMVVRPPSPSPPPQPRRKDHTDIDIYTSRKETEIDIKRSSSRGPSRHRGRSRSASRERVSRPHRHDGELFVHTDTGRLHVDVEARRSHSHGRRAHSEAPPRHHDYEFDESREITSRIDAGGRMGEARNGITKDWTIVDVPPGTERVRMDGAGGASAEVTWSKYSGVRRSKFIPDRDEKSIVSSSSTNISMDRRDRDRDIQDDSRHSSRLSVSIFDKDGHGSKDREIDVIADRRGSNRHHHDASPRGSEMWTEITKDLVLREAIDEMNYEFEETEYFYYIMTYLRYEDVLQLVQLSDAIRRARKERLHEIQWQSGYKDDHERDYHLHAHSHSHSHSHSRPRPRHEDRRKRYDDERIVEREVLYEHSGGSRGYR